MSNIKRNKKSFKRKKRAEVLMEGRYNRRELHYEKEVCILIEEAEIVLHNIVIKQKNTKPYCNQIKRGWEVGSAFICLICIRQSQFQSLAPEIVPQPHQE